MTLKPVVKDILDEGWVVYQDLLLFHFDLRGHRDIGVSDGACGGSTDHPLQVCDLEGDQDHVDILS